MRKPEYLFHPGQAVHRLLRGRERGREFERVVLPWGTPLLIRPNEAIGQAIWRTGVYDVVVSEAILRLAESGETAVDVGANIGVMTSAMGVAVGVAGRVVCFEPHPGLSVELSDNIAQWREGLGWEQVERSELALSEHPGKACLLASARFDANRGTATLSSLSGGEGEATSQFHVVATTLDLALGSAATIELLKVDVEGHELEVFRGASSLLSSGRVRDIIFEEYHSYPSPVTHALESYGYRVFLIRKGLLGPVLQSPYDRRLQLHWETPNYLATKQADRAIEKLGPIGWQSLRRAGSDRLRVYA